MRTSSLSRDPGAGSKGDDQDHSEGSKPVEVHAIGGIAAGRPKPDEDVHCSSNDGIVPASTFLLRLPSPSRSYSAKTHLKMPLLLTLLDFSYFVIL
jgi:hypothetical protein